MKWNELHVLSLLLLLFNSNVCMRCWPLTGLMYASIDGNKIKMCFIFLSFFLHLVNLQAFIFISLAMESVAGQIYCVEKLTFWMAKVKDRPLNTRALRSTWTQPCTSLARKTVIALWQMANHQFVTIYLCCWWGLFSLFYSNIVNWIKRMDWLLFLFSFYWF